MDLFHGLTPASDLDLFSPVFWQRLQVSFVHALGVGHDQVLAPAGQRSGADSHAHRVPEHDGGGKRSALHPCLVFMELCLGVTGSRGC